MDLSKVSVGFRKLSWGGEGLPEWTGLPEQLKRRKAPDAKIAMRSGVS